MCACAVQHKLAPLRCYHEHVTVRILNETSAIVLKPDMLSCRGCSGGRASRCIQHALKLCTICHRTWPLKRCCDAHSQPKHARIPVRYNHLRPDYTIVTECPTHAEPYPGLMSIARRFKRARLAKRLALRSRDTLSQMFGSRPCWRVWCMYNLRAPGALSCICLYLPLSPMYTGAHLPGSSGSWFRARHTTSSLRAFGCGRTH
jgi:hypothetical protein